MGKLLEMLRTHLLDRELTDERRALTERHLRLMSPLIKFCSGETRLASLGSISTETAIAATASLMQIDAETDPKGYGRLGLVCVPLSQMNLLPPNEADYATLFGRLLILEYRHGPKEITVEDWQAMHEAIFPHVGVTFIDTFGQNLSRLDYFEERIRVLLPNNYMSILALATLYALNGYHEGMMRLAPMLRLMPHLMPVGFPIGQGMKLHALCRD